MHTNSYERSRLALAQRIVRTVDDLPRRTIGGTVLIFGLLATLAYHANEPVKARRLSAAPVVVCAPVATPATTVAKEL